MSLNHVVSVATTKPWVPATFQSVTAVAALTTGAGSAVNFGIGSVLTAAAASSFTCPVINVSDSLNLPAAAVMTLPPVCRPTAYVDTMTGPWAAPQNVTVTVRKMSGSNSVRLSLAMTAATATVATIITLSTALAPALRPLDPVTVPIVIINSGAFAVGLAQISVAGLVTISTGTLGTFTAAGTAGTSPSTSISFQGNALAA